MDPKLLFAKVLFFSTALCNVGWTRFQNNALLERGISIRDIGILKGIGLLFKVMGEFVCATVADKHDPVAVFLFCVAVQVYTLEAIRNHHVLTFNYVLFIKFLRGITACLPTLTNALICTLTVGTNEGYGQQRLYGSLAWGVGALMTGVLIDLYGTNSLFFFAYAFYALSACLMLWGSRQAAGPTGWGSGSAGAAGNDGNLLTPSGKLRSGSGSSNGSSNSSGSGGQSGSSSGGSNWFHRLKHPNNSSNELDKLLEDTTVEHKGNTGGTTSNRTWVQCLCDSASLLLIVVSKLIRQSRDSFAKLLGYDALKYLLYNIFVYGAVMTIIDSIVAISLVTDYRTSASFGGIYTGMGVCSCLPAFYLSKSLIERHGHYAVLMFAQCTCVFRLLVNSCLLPSWEYSAYGLLVTQLLHGACFALFWATAVDVMYKLAPPGMKNTSLALLNALYFTVGGAAGNITWSFAYAAAGINTVFFLGAVFLAVNLAFIHFQLGGVLVKQLQIVENMHYQRDRKSVV